MAVATPAATRAPPGGSRSPGSGATSPAGFSALLLLCLLVSLGILLVLWDPCSSMRGRSSPIAASVS